MKGGITATVAGSSLLTQNTALKIKGGMTATLAGSSLLKQNTAVRSGGMTITVAGSSPLTQNTAVTKKGQYQVFHKHLLKGQFYSQFSKMKRKFIESSVRGQMRCEYSWRFLLQYYHHSFKVHIKFLESLENSLIESCIFQSV